MAVGQVVRDTVPGAGVQCRLACALEQLVYVPGDGRVCLHYTPARACTPARTHVHTCTHRYKCLAADACECVEGPGRKAIVDRLDLPPANRYIRGACALLPAPEAPSLEPTLVLDTPTMQGVMHEGALVG